MFIYTSGRNIEKLKTFFEGAFSLQAKWYYWTSIWTSFWNGYKHRRFTLLSVQIQKRKWMKTPLSCSLCFISSLAELIIIIVIVIFIIVFNVIISCHKCIITSFPINMSKLQRWDKIQFLPSLIFWLSNVASS